MRRTPAWPALHSHVANGAAGAGHACRADAEGLGHRRSASTTIARRAFRSTSRRTWWRMSVETYTARRAYQIASEYPPPRRSRRDGRISPDAGARRSRASTPKPSSSARRKACGPSVIDDFRAGRLQRVYRQAQRPPLSGLRPDRSIFAGKRYLPVGTRRGGKGLPFPLRVLRRPVLLRQHSDAAADRGDPRGDPARQEAA